MKGKKIFTKIIIALIIIIACVIGMPKLLEGNPYGLKESGTLYDTILDFSVLPEGIPKLFEKEPSDEEKIPNFFEKEPSHEEKLLTITQTTAEHQLENYVYVDMDHDGSKELIGVYSDNKDLYQTWYCSSDGETCLLVHQNNEGMDACKIELLNLNNETHVVINAYRMMGPAKNYSIICLKENIISCLVSNNNGYVRMTENGDITLDVEAYDGMYDPDIGVMISHTWKDTYLYFDGKTYKEYGATEITEAEFLNYKNSQTIKDKIANELKQSDTTKLEYSYLIRKNNILHIQCDVYSSSGAIQFGYYTFRFSGNVLNEQLGEYTPGQMATSFSDLEVTY